MGYYINPTDRTKEQWLAKHGQLASPSDLIADDHCLVCLVDNGAFTAAGVCYDKYEQDAFSLPDERPRWWYAVSRSALLEVEPSLRNVWPDAS